MIHQILTRPLKTLNCSLFNFARVKFPLPDLGQKIKQGTVKKLYVVEGQKVEQFQKIADVQSDKQFTQITAPENGIIAKIHYNQAQVCKVGDLFMEMDTEGSTNEQKDEKVGIKEESKKVERDETASNKPESEKPKKEVWASPAVRILASHGNIDLSKIKGTGLRGMVTKSDLIQYLEKQKLQPTPKAQLSAPRSEGYPDIRVQMNSFQKGMQKSMTQANKVPHLYYHQSVDVTELNSVRESLKKSGLKVTVMGLLIKTFSLALNAFPRMNSTYRPDKDQYSFSTHESHNISLAMDTPNGLVVPNIKNVQNLSIVQIQKNLGNLKKLADEAKLTRDHLEGGTICLSNIGTIAGVSACPLVLYPQICIVAIGKMTEVPVLREGEYRRRQQMTLSFGCDHRVVDGASVARFSNQWKKVIENPYLALASLR